MGGLSEHLSRYYMLFNYAEYRNICVANEQLEICGA